MKKSIVASSLSCLALVVDCRAGYACQGSSPDRFCDVANESKESGEK